jgi:hypothetical protein
VRVIADVRRLHLRSVPQADTLSTKLKGRLSEWQCD